MFFAPGIPSPAGMLSCCPYRYPKHSADVQVVLDETAELLRADHGRLIFRTRHGFTCANAGVDQSNAGDPHGGAPARRP